MTKFNPQNKKTLTYGEALDPAMGITEQADADQYKAAYVEFVETFLINGKNENGKNENGKTAEQIVNENLGYWAGYGSDETRERIERLFKCSHPIFGSIKLNGSPTPEKALSMGMQAGADKSKN